MRHRTSLLGVTRICIKPKFHLAGHVTTRHAIYSMHAPSPLVTANDPPVFCPVQLRTSNMSESACDLRGLRHCLSLWDGSRTRISFVGCFFFDVKQYILHSDGRWVWTLECPLVTKTVPFLPDVHTSRIILSYPCVPFNPTFVWICGSLPQYKECRGPLIFEHWWWRWQWWRMCVEQRLQPPTITVSGSVSAPPASRPLMR